jgi:hypothetical protein
VIAKVIVAAATDAKPKLRYTAGSGGGRVSMLRRLVPARIFDKQIRTINRMTQSSLVANVTAAGRGSGPFPSHSRPAVSLARQPSSLAVALTMSPSWASRRPTFKPAATLRMELRSTQVAPVDRRHSFACSLHYARTMILWS